MLRINECIGNEKWVPTYRFNLLIRQIIGISLFRHSGYKFLDDQLLQHHLVMVVSEPVNQSISPTGSRKDYFLIDLLRDLNSP